MPSDYRVSVGFFDHPKTIKLQRLLGDAAPLNLLRLWAHATQFKPSGVLSGMDADDIAIAARWNGDADALVDALVRVGFIDRMEDGTLELHDWIDHNGFVATSHERSEQAKLAAAARWEKSQKKGAAPESHADLCDAHSDPHANRNAPYPSPNPNPSPDRTRVARKRAHASKQAQAVDGEPEGSATDLEEQNLAGSAGLEAEDVVPPAGPAGLPKPAASVLTEAQVAALAAVLWPGATIRPDQVPNGVASWLRQEYPPQDYPAVHATWRDLGPGGRAAWCAEALVRPAVQAKPAKDRMRSAARHIGRALHDGFDLLTERDDAPSPSAVPSQPAPQGTRFDHYPWAKWWMHDLYRGMAPDGRLLACAKEAKAAGWPVDPDDFLERYYADRGDRSTLIERFMSELWALKPGASEAGKVA